MREDEAAGAVNGIYRVFSLICGLLLLVGVAFSIIEIFFRFFLNHSWPLGQIGIWIALWGVFIYAGLFLLREEYLAFDFIRSGLKGIAGVVLAVINALFCLVFGLGVFWIGLKVITSPLVQNDMFPMKNIPWALLKSCIPIGMLGFSICAVVLLVKRIVADSGPRT